jgi:hypothetical protein
MGGGGRIGRHFPYGWLHRVRGLEPKSSYCFKNPNGKPVDDFSKT